MLKEIINKLDKRTTVLMAVILCAIVIAEITLTCIIPVWKEYFFDVLQNKQIDKFSLAVTLFLLLTLSLGCAQGTKAWVSQKLSLLIRSAGNKVLLKKWVYSDREQKNYTQPITEALKNWTEYFIYTVVEVIISASIIIGLVLANLNSPLILWGSLVYTIIITAVATVFNKPLVNSDATYQSSEGIYRESISDIKNGNGDYTAKQKYLDVVANYSRYIKVTMYFTLFSRLKNSTASVVPFILLSTSYFSGAISLGDFMAGVATFELIVVNSTILLEIYPKYTKMLASYNLSKGFYESLNGSYNSHTVEDVK